MENFLQTLLTVTKSRPNNITGHQVVQNPSDKFHRERWWAVDFLPRVKGTK